MTKRTPDPAAAPAPDARAELHKWFDAHIRNSRYSRDTATHNRLHDLVRQIDDALAACPGQ